MKQLEVTNVGINLRRPLALVLVIGVFLLSCMLLFLAYTIFLKPYPTLLSTTSPNNTYTVSVRGRNTQQFFFTAQVRYDVLKNGVPILLNEFLSSADGMDYPFQFKYPDHRWIGEHCLQFYRKEDLQESAPDVLVVANNTGKRIRYAKIQGIDIVLILEMEPGFNVTMPTARSRGDTKWMDITGQFVDGSAVKKFSADIAVNDVTGPKTFYVNLAADKTTVDRKN